MKIFLFFLSFYLFSFDAISQNRTIHVLVTLCDNEYQGIVKVPAAIGNGQKPQTNLYWGCGYGIKTFFKKHTQNWKLLQTILKPDSVIYERLIFKHKDSAVFLVADAYDGAKIKQTTIDLLAFSAGYFHQSLIINNQIVKFGGGANLIAYVGHNGLMDFDLTTFPKAQDSQKRETVILACASKQFFVNPLRLTGSYPLVWTTGLMCPEAYTMAAIADAWAQRESPSAVRLKAAIAYNQYQKCGLKGAKNLLVTGWK